MKKQNHESKKSIEMKSLKLQIKHVAKPPRLRITKYSSTNTQESNSSNQFQQMYQSSYKLDYSKGVPTNFKSTEIYDIDIVRQSLSQQFFDSSSSDIEIQSCQ
ncbi:hypothetical protein SS50377_21192 [Spironucleus salmonicida]|uniref:Uncharacterized protein n=1 Tax=Spironucleus salmonicida TaxID=348837 RepID=A0A9P8M0U6_9EUKA|nr:hypothetical protein SS50377_21192 [Spironucleus salmonicida]